MPVIVFIISKSISLAHCIRVEDTVSYDALSAMLFLPLIVERRTANAHHTPVAGVLFSLLVHLTNLLLLESNYR
jgi:hypothetical protein